MQCQNNFGPFIKSVGSCCGKSRQKKNDSLAITQRSTITIRVYENLHNITKTEPWHTEFLEKTSLSEIRISGTCTNVLTNVKFPN